MSRLSTLLGATLLVASGCVSVGPVGTPAPTVAPTAVPTSAPTQPPTAPPTLPPTEQPTLAPTATPQASASAEPPPTVEPTQTGEPQPTPTLDPNATPTETPLDILPFLTSEVTVLNLGVETLTVTVTFVDPESTDEYDVGVFEIAPEQVTAQLIPSARFRLEFAFGATDVAVCTIDIATDEQIQFAVIETGAMLTTSGPEPVDAAEMLVSTSSRCDAGDTT